MLTTKPSGEGSPGRPQPYRTVGKGLRSNPRHRPLRRQPPHPRRRPAPHTYRQRPPPARVLVYSPGARALLRSVRRSRVPQPTMGHQGDRHHACPSRGPLLPRTRSSGASPGWGTAPRPAPWPKSPRGERATTWDCPCAACPSGSSAAGRPQGPYPRSGPSPLSTDMLRWAPTHGWNPPQGDNTPSAAGTAQ